MTRTCPYEAIHVCTKSDTHPYVSLPTFTSLHVLRPLHALKRRFEVWPFSMKTLYMPLCTPCTLSRTPIYWSFAEKTFVKQSMMLWAFEILLKNGRKTGGNHSSMNLSSVVGHAWAVTHELSSATGHAWVVTRERPCRYRSRNLVAHVPLHSPVCPTLPKCQYASPMYLYIPFCTLMHPHVHLYVSLYMPYKLHVCLICMHPYVSL